MKNSKRNVAIGLGFIAVAGVAGSAFANTLGTVPPSNAGQGVSVTNGYNVANVRFTSTAAGGGSGAANISAVLFDIRLATGATAVPTTGHTVLARANSTGNWVACSVAAVTTTCNITPTIASITGVEIVAFKSA